MAVPPTPVPEQKAADKERIVFVLVASPLGGAFTWRGVADELNSLGRTAIVVEPRDEEEAATPFWLQEANSAAVQVGEALGPNGRLLLVAHSGAGTLLPAIGDRLHDRVAGYIVVDGPIPRDGESQLTLMRHSAPQLAEVVSKVLAAGGSFPVLGDDHLRSEITDDALRRAVLAEARPRAARFYEERVTVPAGWPDAPCGYVQLSATQAPAFAEASACGWACLRTPGHHFLMVTEPVRVARLLLELSFKLVDGVVSRLAETAGPELADPITVQESES